MLEEQIDLYILVQCMRYLLAKLYPDLQTDIITYYKVLQQRDDLILLAIYLKNSKRKASSSSSSSRSDTNHKCFASNLQSRGQTKKKRSSSLSRDTSLLDYSKQDLSTVECYACYKKGYYSNNCPKKQSSATCKVGASKKKLKKKAKPKAESPPSKG